MAKWPQIAETGVVLKTFISSAQYYYPSDFHLSLSMNQISEKVCIGQ